ncbi:flagellar hook-length control protein FliK [Clostridium sp. 19966]|uniref:flagellar hook-length control protein FliK n=1 Tax=Clostridium sp. 19966 TaxID=2768166 RepID=UPI0028DD4CA9|nr:flagellar hook-length control protein FliK [Clostridium sp. 19966]MDT8716652.1 flagellar hook-length control protein FliK [Clostridium sp. 19966]
MMNAVNVNVDTNITAVPSSGNTIMKSSSKADTTGLQAKNDANDSKDESVFSKILKENKKNSEDDSKDTTDQALNVILASLFGILKDSASQVKPNQLANESSSLKTAMSNDNLIQLKNNFALSSLADKSSISELMSKLAEALKSSKSDQDKAADIKSILSKLFSQSGDTKFQVNIPVKHTNSTFETSKTDINVTSKSDTKADMLDNIKNKLDDLLRDLNQNGASTKVDAAAENSDDKITKIAAALENLYNKLSAKNNTEAQTNDGVKQDFASGNSDLKLTDNSITKEKTSNDAGENKSSLGFQQDKEDSFLKSITSGNSDDATKTTKLNLYMNMFNPDKTTVKTQTVTGQTPVINQNTMVSDVVKSIKYMEANNLKELTVKINPKDLGEIVIKVTMEAGNMKANIDATNKDTYNILNSHFQDLKDSMNNSSIKIQDFNIGLYYGDTTFFKDGSQRQQQDFQQGFNSKAAKGDFSDEAVEPVEETTNITDNNIDKLV